MQARHYRSLVQAITTDPSNSNWLRKAILELDRRDPVDAAMDAAILAKLADLRMTKECGIHRTTCVQIEPASVAHPPRSSPALSGRFPAA